MKYRRDIDLWKSIKKGDLASFEYVYHSNYKDLYFYGLKLSSEENVTQDCIHDLFVQIWSNKEMINEVHSIKPYLIKCFRRRLLKMMNQASHSGIELSDSRKEESPHRSAEDAIMEEESKYERIEMVTSAMKDLTKRQREAIHLRFFMGFDYDEICEVMNLKYQTVRNLVCESIKVMRLGIENPASSG